MNEMGLFLTRACAYIYEPLNKRDTVVTVTPVIKREDGPWPELCVWQSEIS